MNIDTYIHRYTHKVNNGNKNGKQRMVNKDAKQVNKFMVNNG